MNMSKKAAMRKGIVLLLVLAILAAFGLIVLAYVVLTGHTRRGAEAAKRFEEQYDPPEQVVEQVLMQVLRGTNDPHSSIWSHSLLEDMYGDAGATVKIPNGSGFQIFGTPQFWAFPPPSGVTAPESLVGRMLTFTSGPAIGRSTRIVGYQPARPETVPPTSALFVILAPNDVSLPMMQKYDRPMEYVLNGFPFSGTGVERSAALNPNSIQMGNNLSANEDYDAADYQNMFLAMLIQDPLTGQVIVPEPSFHRPALANYWIAQGKTTPQEQRKFILRPLRAFHPDFPYPPLPPEFDPVNGPWDVDNDCDGVPDSIWVDVGLPVRTLPDGRRYKPLAAILCLDLDGRLNLNAHGETIQTQSYYYYRDPLVYDGSNNAQFRDFAVAPGLIRSSDGDNLDVTNYLPPMFDENDPLNANNLTRVRRWFRGSGFGPAEINLAPVFQLLSEDRKDPDTAVRMDKFKKWHERYAEFLLGRKDVTDPLERWVSGRYGESRISTLEFPILANNLLTIVAARAPWSTGVEDLLWLRKFPNYPLDWRLSVPTLVDPSNLVSTVYGTPPDAMGLISIALSTNGDPIYLQPDVLWGVGRLVNPYRLRLVGARNARIAPDGRDEIDSPFSPAEFEALLRPFDVDSKDLPQRLYRLLDSNDVNCPRAVNLRHLLTTEAWDVPAPSLGEARNQLASAISLVPELAAGLRVNVNRLLTAGEASKQQLAHDIYIAMMVALRPHAPSDGGGEDSQPVSSPPSAREVAQWAANIVDFVDRDAIMTRFDFDTDPFDGTWVPDDVVWGCERPELLITETLAFHDRRTEDLAVGGQSYDEGGAPQDPDGDNDLDQQYRPKGSLFVELYNPWPAAEPKHDELGGAAGVNLQSLAPDNTPVWRLAVVRHRGTDPGAVDPSPVDPDDKPANEDEVSLIERLAYFVPANQNPNYPIEGALVVYYPTVTQTSIVAPKEHLVLAPAVSTPVHGGPLDVSTLSHMIMGGVLNTQDDPPRFSVTEPAWGYKAIAARFGSTYDPNSEVFSPALDWPLDRISPVRPSDIDPANPPVSLWWAGYFGRDFLADGFSVVHLQRLANPTQPYNPATNPYRTIDSAPVDVSFYNSLNDLRDPSLDGADQGDSYPDEPIDFHSRERGKYNNPPRRQDPDQQGEGPTEEPTAEFILWKQEPVQRIVPPKVDPNDDEELEHSLGKLNTVFGGPGVMPTKAFPWLTFFNRPLSNPFELFLVPRYRSSQLLRYDATNYYKYYAVVADSDANAANPYAQTAWTDPYPHLINFFRDRAGGSDGDSGEGTGGESGGEEGAEEEPTGLYRILEVLRVASPFAGTETPVQGTEIALEFREPGRINLNTIYSPEVFRALLNEPESIYSPEVFRAILNDPTATLTPAEWDDLANPIVELWHDFLVSRRGYADNGTATAWLLKMLTLDSSEPSRFSKPFRSFGMATDVSDTLLRYRSSSKANEPFFQSPSMPDEYCDTNRNPFFRYRRLMRLGNLVTTRSNVYAIWITVGYFEVQPVMEVAQPDPDAPGNFLINGMSLSPQDIADIYPDGYMLGQELGSDTGEIQRHRGFFIYDRSIPVGFKRGYDLNVDQGLLIRRIID